MAGGANCIGEIAHVRGDMFFYMAEGMDAMEKAALGAVKDARELITGHQRES